VKLIVELDDGTSAGELASILDSLADHRPYVRSGWIFADDQDSEGDYAAAGGGGLGTEWW
jgi:hypothetical protein